ncbi:MAG: heme biosynthesis protein HemY [Robiginitomaculum sp.]|nr:MAG: heme biosynthesis protein HemY [Robiginitomaculum sp.]
MIRLAFYVAIALLIGIFAFWLAAHPGQVAITAFGFEIRTSAAVSMVVLLLLTFAFAFFWRGLGWLIELPEQVRKGRAQSRRDKGYDALEMAVIAAASGDAQGAVKNAERVKMLLDRPALSGLLAARAAEAVGDIAGAERQYQTLLEDKRTVLAARRGLVRAALERRDYGAAIKEAMAALDAEPGAKWAFDALFDAQVAARDWGGAIATLSRGEKRSHIVPLAAKRRRAVLLAAESAEAEARGDMDEARRLAEKAVGAAPGFAPGAALAARLLVAAGKSWRAAGLLEDAWAAKPHPALALAYRDLKEDEKPRARAKRLRGLVELNPKHRESRIFAAEIARDEEDVEAAREAIMPVLESESPPSSRLCTLMNQIERKAGHRKAANGWLTRSLSAPSEPDWSDLDPEGPAFGYRDEDWARLVYSYGDAGELIHPRHERFERIPLNPDQMLFLEAQHAEDEADDDADGEESASVADIPESTEDVDAVEEEPQPIKIIAPAKPKRPRRRRAAKPREKAKAPETIVEEKKPPSAPSPDLNVAGFPRQPDDPGPLVEDEGEDDADVQSRKREVH